jgi:hypothetical protein
LADPILFLGYHLGYHLGGWEPEIEKGAGR